MDRVKRIWYLSPMRAAKVQARLRIRAVSPEPSLLAHISSESRGTFRQKARSLAPLNGWACAVKICHDEMLEDTNSLDGAPICLNDRRSATLCVASHCAIKSHMSRDSANHTCYYMHLYYTMRRAPISLCISMKKLLVLGYYKAPKGDSDQTWPLRRQT